MLLGVTQIFLFTLVHNERTRENREKGREKGKGNRNPLGSARFSVFLAGLLYTIISSPALRLIVRAHTHTHTHIHRSGKVRATQARGIQWHETALRYSAFHLGQKSGGSGREESVKERGRGREEEGTLKATVATDLSNPGIRGSFCSKRYLLIPGFAVIRIST